MIIKPPIRGTDNHGAGYFEAPRGSSLHHGVDIACYGGSQICSLTPGIVTLTNGYPYDPDDPRKGHFRYVQVTLDGNHYRYFYVMASVKKGDMVIPGDVIGEAQGWIGTIRDMTDHIHFEHIDPDGRYADPTEMVFGDEN